MNESQLTQRVPDLLKTVMPYARVRVRQGPQQKADAGLRSPHLVAELKVGAKMRRLLIEVTLPGYPARLLQAFQALDLARGRYGGYPVVVTDAISERGAGLAKEAGIGFLDLAGNCWLNLGEIYIDKTSPQRRPRPRWNLRRLFSPKATRVIRTLLEHPTTSWEIVELAKASRVSIGHAYKVAHTLLQQAFLAKEKKRVRLREAGALLDLWAEQYRVDPTATQSFYTELKDPSAIMAHIAQAAAQQNLTCALTMHAGASLVAPFTRFTDVHVYLSALPSDALLQAFKLERIEFGGTVHLMTPYDEGVFHHGRVIEGLPVVCNTQLYLDLFQYPTRGKEAADFLRRERMKV